MPAQKSPGPADYSLKPLIGYSNHETNSQFVRSPGWSIPQRPKTTAYEMAPSAATYKVGIMTRNGKPPGVPATIGMRPRTTRIERSSGLYNTVDVTVYKSSPGPKYTIGLRTVASRASKDAIPPLYDATPLSIYKHTAPKFSMTGKRAETAVDKGPGPMKYDTSKSYMKYVATQPPAFTILARPKDTSGKERQPGPANYDLMNYNPFANAPKYTHRPKHSAYEHVSILPQDNC